MGWAITNRLPCYLYTQGQESVYKVHVAIPDWKLDLIVKTWWGTKNFGCPYDSNTLSSVEDENVMKSLKESTWKVDSRYEVSLIWRDDKDLPENYMYARATQPQRIYFLEKRRNSDPGCLLREYY